MSNNSQSYDNYAVYDFTRISDEKPSADMRGALTNAVKHVSPRIRKYFGEVKQKTIRRSLIRNEIAMNVNHTSFQY